MEEIKARLGNATEGHVLPAREDYYGVSIVDLDNAWAVGTYGTVLKISGSGSKIELQDSGVRSSLFCVDFADSRNGLIGGKQGLILRTTDGGQTWKKVQTPKGVTRNILALGRGSDKNQVWAVGPYGTVLHSSNGGESWETLDLKRDVTLNGVAFVNDQEGWVTGEFGEILHTTDGGHTWQEQKNVTGLPKYIEDVTDEEARRRGIPEMTEEDLYLFEPYFVSQTEGYVAAVGGYVLHTIDSGATWQLIKSPTHNTLFSIAIPHNKAGAAVGVLGTLVHYQQGAWSRDMGVSQMVFTWLRAIDFDPGGQFGLAVGGEGTLLTSHDGGEVWNRIPRQLLAQAAS